MSKEACQKEILCMGIAISKLGAIAKHLDFLCKISENNYRDGLDVDINDIAENTKRIEQVVNQASKIVKTLS